MRRGAAVAASVASGAVGCKSAIRQNPKLRALSARLRFARANQPDLIMMRKDARYRPPAPKPVCWTYFPFPSGLTTWRAHDEKPGQWTERVFIMMIPTSVR